MNDKISFEGTLDEVAAVTLRAAELSGSLSKARWTGASVCAPFGALGLYAATIHNPIDVKLGFAALGAVAGGTAYWLMHKKAVWKEVRALVAGQYGGKGPLRCEYELSEDGLVYRIFGNETKFPWSSVTGAAETADSLDIVFGTPLTVGWIPRRAFRDEAHMKAWLDRMRAEISAKT